MSGEARGDPESPPGVSWHREVPDGASPSSRRSHDPIDKYAACQGTMPSNYAFDDDEGYAGMLLYQLSPRLGEFAYPIIATQAAERYMAAVLFIGISISLPPLIVLSLPRRMAYVSFMVLIPALHRLALVHTRRTFLVFRQFEPWFLLVSSMIFIVSIATSDAYIHGKIYAINMCTAGWSAFTLDGIRMPYKIVLYTATAYMVVTAFWTLFWLATGVAMGRMATMALFFTKYTVNLLLRPDAYVVLRRPLFVRDTRSIIEKGYCSTNPAAAGLLRRLSSRLKTGRSSAFAASRVVPLQMEATATAANISNPLLPPTNLQEASDPPTARSTKDEPTSHPPESPIQPSAGPPSPVLPDMEAPSSPSRNIPRRLPPLQTLNASSPANPLTASASASTSAQVPSNESKAPHDASDPLPSRPEPSTCVPSPQPLEDPPMLLHHHLHVPAPFIELLSRPTIHRLESYLWLATSILCTVPLLLPAPVPPQLLHLSWLWPLIMLRRLLFVYPELVLIQLLQFETWLLLGNVGFALMTIKWRLFTTGPAKAWAINLLLSTLPVVFMDGLHLEAPVKRRITATHSLFMLCICAVETWYPCNYMDQGAMLTAYTSAGSFFMGRLFTLAIFFLKYAVNLWLRPDIFLVLCAPLMRNQRLGLHIDTLRDL